MAHLPRLRLRITHLQTSCAHRVTARQRQGPRVIGRVRCVGNGDGEGGESRKARRQAFSRGLGFGLGLGLGLGSGLGLG